MAEKVITPDLLKMARDIHNGQPMSKSDIKAFQKSMKDLGFKISSDGVSGEQTQTVAMALMISKKLESEFGFDSSALRPDLLVAMAKDTKVNEAARAHIEALKLHNDKPGTTKINIAISSNQVFQESGFNPRALHTHSEDPSKNSYGMYQFTLTTGKKYELTSIEDLNNPDKARQAYIRHTAESLSAKEVHGDPILNLVAYNAGPKAIEHVRKKLGKDSITGEEWLAYMRNKAAERALKPENLGKNPENYLPIKGSDGKMHDQKMAWDQVTLQYVEKIMYGKTAEKPHTSPAAGTTTVKAKTAPKEENLSWIERTAKGFAKFVDKANDKTLMAAVKGEIDGSALKERLAWLFNRRATQFASLVSGVDQVLHARDEQNRRETLQFAANQPPKSEEKPRNPVTAPAKTETTREQKKGTATDRVEVASTTQTSNHSEEQARLLMSSEAAQEEIRQRILALSKSVSLDEIIEEAKDKIKKFSAEGNTYEVTTAFLGLTAALNEKYKDSPALFQKEGDAFVASLDPKAREQLLLTGAIYRNNAKDAPQQAQEQIVEFHLDPESASPLMIAGVDGNNRNILASLQSNPLALKNALAEVIISYAENNGNILDLERKLCNGFAMASRKNDPAHAALHWAALETSVQMRLAADGGESLSADVLDARLKIVMESYVKDLNEDKQALNMLASLGVAVPKDGLSGDYQHALRTTVPLEKPAVPDDKIKPEPELISSISGPKTPGMA